jgi:hypothetical protein
MPTLIDGVRRAGTSDPDATVAEFQGSVLSTSQDDIEALLLRLMQSGEPES